MTIRILLIDDNPEEYGFMKKRYPDFEWVWLPSMIFAKLLLQFDRKFNEILVDISGTSMPGRWESEVRELETWYKGKITAISNVFTPMDSPVTFYTKDDVLGYLTKSYDVADKYPG